METLIPAETWEEDIRLAKITLDRGLQVRYIGPSASGAFFREDVVQDYRDLLEEGVDLGLLELVQELDAEQQETGRLLLADGFHRLEAHRRIGYETVCCRLRRGDFLTALLIGTHLNGGRGLQFTLPDRRHVAEMLLQALGERGLTWSDAKIARHAGIHRRTVAKVRSELSSRFRLPQERQVLRGGQQVYTMTPGQQSEYRHDDLLDELPGADERIELPAQPRSTIRKTNVSSPQPTLKKLPHGEVSSVQAPLGGKPPALAAMDLLEIEQQKFADALRQTNDAPPSDGITFILEWRRFAAGHPQEQGVENHITPSHRLPDDVRATLLAWLHATAE